MSDGSSDGLSENKDSAHKELCINTIRTLSMDAVQKANSGHPGAPMGIAPAGYVLFTQIMRHNPKNPDWHNRDRFVLSGGHASMLIYSLLHLTGYDLSLDDIKEFRQWGSKTPGHPEYGHTPGVETTTGPLGQGIANAVGMAMAERHLAARFNKPEFEIIDHHTYVVCGDGDMMEGIASEAASLAGHLGLGKLVCLYDDNKITIEGRTEITFTEDVCARFEAYNWHVQKVENGNDPDAILEAVNAAKKNTDKPSLIAVNSNIAFGSPNKQDTSDAHGAPLGEEEIKLTKKNLGWPEDKSFYIPDDVLDTFRTCVPKGNESESEWQTLLNGYKEKYPELAQQYLDAMTGNLPGDWEKSICKFNADDGPIATRAASGKVLNSITDDIPEFIGGSADLAPSNVTIIKNSNDYQKDNYIGRNIRFGVREHAQGAILNGMCVHKGVRPYGGTFLVFADYMRPSIRIAGLMKQPIIYVFTHDSVAVGEDGPTHQPVEHLASLRTLLGVTVIRPADATETAEAWKLAIKSQDSPVALILSRQNLPVIDRTKYPAADNLSKGAYVLADSEGTPDIILMSTGAEVHLAIGAKAELEKDGHKVRVVSMPSWELFEKTSSDYKDEILPPEVSKRLAIEAGISMGWEKYTGSSGTIIGINTFGASAPGNIVLEKYGFTIENVVDKAKNLLNK